MARFDDRTSCANHVTSGAKRPNRAAESPARVAPPPHCLVSSLGNVPFARRARKLNHEVMTREQIEAIVKTAQAKQDKEGAHVLPEGSNLTLHVAHDGASLSVQKLESVRFEGELL